MNFSVSFSLSTDCCYFAQMHDNVTQKASYLISLPFLFSITMTEVLWSNIKVLLTMLCLRRSLTSTAWTTPLVKALGYLFHYLLNFQSHRLLRRQRWKWIMPRVSSGLGLEVLMLTLNWSSIQTTAVGWHSERGSVLCMRKVWMLGCWFWKITEVEDNRCYLKTLHK